MKFEFEGGCVIESDVVSRTTFAAAQNAVPVIRRLLVRNNSERTYKQLSLRLTAQPAFCRPKQWHIGPLHPNQSTEVHSKQLEFDHAILDQQTEAEHGHLVFELFEDNEKITEQATPIELLGRDEWPGLDMPQILAAFISPNDLTISNILKNASNLLVANNHKGAIDGYSANDPARIHILASAIWSVICGMDLTYAQPPSSFESQGQKIRSSATIASTQLATCLDSTLLLASCFEAAGLNPVVLFTEGHAFVGLWITESTFPMTLEEDVIQVRKAIDAKELVVLESTLLTQKPKVGFSEATANGHAQLLESSERVFHLAIDINRARLANIRPISSKINQGSPAGTTEEVAVPPPLERPSTKNLPEETIEEQVETPQGRLDRWQRKLLDLTNNNRLLNFRPSKQNLKLICSDVAALEDGLADGQSFQIISIKDENVLGNRDAQLYREQTGKDIELEFVSSVFEKKQICSVETERETRIRLTNLFRKAKSDLSEGGANTLFLAIGFLRWKKKPEDEKSYMAPLLLMPAKLSRRSVNSIYSLSEHEDDVVFNQTLLELLKRDFGLVIPSVSGDLPDDHSGHDIERIFSNVRQAVRNVRGFEVVEECALSTFSFSKYLMWKDLVDRTASLRNNRLVKHLLDSPTKPFDGGVEGLPGPDAIDRETDPSQLYTPLPADSSQLAAIIAAERGKDFVIIGPPGTGKSQTISNMIAHCLAHGKTILFVAEKAAALNVVHRRLKAQGLSDSCLELHSNKTDRKSVLRQLGAAWDRSGGKSSQEWGRVCGDLKLRQEDLNEYVAELHQPGSHGKSPFDAIGLLGDRAAKFDLGFKAIDSHDETAYENLLSLVEHLALAHSKIGGSESLHIIKQFPWSFSWEKSLLEAATQLSVDTNTLLDACGNLIEKLGLPSSERFGNTRLSALVEVTKLLPDISQGEFSFLGNASLSTLPTELEEVDKQIAEYHEARGQLVATYDDIKIQQMPVQDLDAQWRSESARFWPFSFFGKLRIRKILQSYATTGKSTPEVELQPLIKMQRALSVVSSSPSNILPGFKGIHSDVPTLSKTLEVALAFRAACKELEEAWGRAKSVLPSLESVLPEAQQSNTLNLIATDVRNASEQFRLSMKGFAEYAGGVPEVKSLQAITEMMAALHREKKGLENWVIWLEVKDQASAKGLQAFVSSLEQGLIDDPVRDFQVAYFHWWLPLAIDEMPKLRGFAHWEHEGKVEQFRTLASKLQDLATERIKLAVSHNLPARDEVPKKSELGFLRHQLGLQRPSASIRSLVENMPTTLLKLTPCVLMSPLSVAQYLPADHTLFDVVIFDEASQITTWDAIGTLARGKQSIIVGDPKQLPPTNFFARSDQSENEDIDYTERDQLSILDEAADSGLPTRQLNWHYRSRDESLIAFSNKNYYRNRLVTFPSPQTATSAVTFHKVNGEYLRGSDRTNPIEAKEIVAFVFSKLEEWKDWPIADRLSIGVITFNVQQQELILDNMEKELADRPDLEYFFSSERVEPVIVKNLENVQGDERDVMVFSITFGRDKAGKFYRDFGPLNREGGEKRLNVAITRAKSEFHVFSSITASDIDVKGIKHQGVRDLKNYLDYAERGQLMPTDFDNESPGEVKHPFEELVANALISRGWEVQTQIGVSEFKIDLGVIHPDSPDSFLAGIECDGQTYHCSATARDRDQVREGVLRNLGWQILRVWSTDWFKRKEEALERIDVALNKLLDESRRAILNPELADDASPSNASTAQTSQKVDETSPAPSTTTDVSPYNALNFRRLEDE